MAPPAPPAPPAVCHFARFRCKKGVEIIFDLSKMTPKQPDVFCGDRTDVFFETGQMSAVETGQMSAVETRQMSSAETRQMSTGKTGRCPVSLLYIRHVSAEDICLVSTADICPLYRRHLSRLNNTCNRDGSRQPYSNFSNRPHPPRQNRGAVLMGIAVWRVTEKPKQIKWQWGQYVR